MMVSASPSQLHNGPTTATAESASDTGGTSAKIHLRKGKMLYRQ